MVTDSALQKRSEHEKEGGVNTVNKKGISVDRMINECEPYADIYDRRILYELTGMKLNEDDYHDDSSIEDESNDR